MDVKCDATNNLDKVDILKVAGPLTVEEKACHLSTFMLEGTAEYNPHILVATSDASNAGIDSNKIYCVVKLYMQSTCVFIVQEHARAGQFDAANPTLCTYIINICIKSFEYKLCQTLSNNSAVIDNL